MTQVTVRQIDEEWVEEAKRLAKERGVSMNAVLRDAIMTGLGFGEKPKTNGLEKFAGSMPFESKAEEGFWRNYLDVELVKIDERDWE